ncbi:Exportin-1 [Smittium mucronatum]|uniref:Exportin-1 n=1 Tax=Smittium mucronatum TaxID=133383 RepID=A0A1R0H2P7_9FUNG|nr:Exportin-1 [Smittium mucronatum]
MQVLTQFQENPDSWTKVDKILEKSTLSQTKFISLQILEKLIQTRWKIISPEQQNGIKNYIVDTIIKNSSSELSLKKNKLYLSKLNLILVQILKQEWPANWPTFIPEIVSSSKTNISLCENNMEILKLLSEEVFDFSAEKLTQAKIIELKKQLNGEFSEIFQLCNEVLNTAMQPSLVKATLETLLRFIDFAEEWENLEQDEQELVQNVVQFLTTILGNHLHLLEKNVSPQMIEAAHLYLINIMSIDDREIFKVCLEYNLQFVKGLFEDSRKPKKESLLNLGQIESGTRQNYYPGVLTALRVVVIDKMVKPEEVLIVENDDGEIVREFIKETDTIVLYSTQRECLVYLTHLDPNDMEEIMMAKLSVQLNLNEWSWASLNSLCWAFGSISGAMSEDQERKFLVVVIKGLLGLCEIVKGKDNKAVVASNIMYVVGQYPRFLRAHWRFLKTVSNKLFEFMHEMHPGVRDMACDTFIKLADKCKRHFIVTQADETEPFINEIITKIEEITSDLEPQQTSTFFNATARIIASQQDPQILGFLLNGLMRLPNSHWEQALKIASEDQAILEKTEINKSISSIIRINISVCEPIGSKFLPQLAHMYLDMMGMYHALAGLISKSISENGDIASRYPNIRAMKSVKKDCLKLIETYISLCSESDYGAICQNIVPTFFDVVLPDYNGSNITIRDAGVLSCLAVMVKKLGSLISDRVFSIFENVFIPTLNMINKDFSDFPDHRTEFYNLLYQLVSRMFNSLLNLSPGNFKLLVDSIVWGFKHTTRDIADVSLKILLELINSFSSSEPNVANVFFQTFYISLLQDILYVLTDSDHKSGFRSQCLVLSKLLEYIQSPIISVPIYDPSLGDMTNAEFVFKYIVDLLGNAFPNLNSMQLNAFVTDLAENNRNTEQFRLIVKDFLVKLNVFSEDNPELFFAERKHEHELLNEAKRKKALAIPGMLKPSEMEDIE